MANDLAIFEGQLKPLAPRFAEVLPATITPDRLIRTAWCCRSSASPRLLECDPAIAVQRHRDVGRGARPRSRRRHRPRAFLIPFKNRAQLVIGYKGYNTMAARSGITITGKTVREGDKFDFDLAEGWVMHKPELGNKGRIIAAWAKAAANGRPAIVEVLSIDDLMAVKAKSPGAARGDSPWNDPAIGFPAMCEKTAKRRLARSLPLNIMHLAARMDEAVDEQGHAAFISADKTVVVEGEVIAPHRGHRRHRASSNITAPRQGDAVPGRSTMSHPQIRTPRDRSGQLRADFR